jgi:hypothetical protein
MITDVRAGTSSVTPAPPQFDRKLLTVLDYMIVYGRGAAVGSGGQHGNQQIQLRVNSGTVHS